ncbi:MAG TPA: hypothetical protein PKE66_16400, partial [Pyrinomonadaceae bacterium]|nr:hypothetical protein [Pyrinomonadaceae bacterium]
MIQARIEPSASGLSRQNSRILFSLMILIESVLAIQLSHIAIWSQDKYRTTRYSLKSTSLN